MTDEPEELLTVKEFAKRANVSVSTVRNWAYARLIPCLRVGYIVRIPLHRAMAALEKRTVRDLESLQDA
jgi:excisionase family DNA binding protein